MGKYIKNFSEIKDVNRKMAKYYLDNGNIKNASKALLTKKLKLKDEAKEKRMIELDQSLINDKLNKRILINIIHSEEEDEDEIKKLVYLLGKILLKIELDSDNDQLLNKIKNQSPYHLRFSPNTEIFQPIEYIVMKKFHDRKEKCFTVNFEDDKNGYFYLQELIRMLEEKDKHLSKEFLKEYPQEKIKNILLDFYEKLSE